MNILTDFLKQDGYLWLAVLLFAVGLVLIIRGGDVFVDAASWLAEVTGIPKLIVGATVVSFATTLPELLVSVFATIGGNFGIATGNAIGSVTANLGLIMAVSILFLPSDCKREDYFLKSILMLLPLVIMFIFGTSFGTHVFGNGSINLICATILFAIFAIYVFENVRGAKKQLDFESKLLKDEDKPKKPEKKAVVTNIVFFIVGAICIIVGAELLVETASVIASYFGVPDAVIGLTIVAVGTSLPELVTTITALVKKESSLSVGNIIGANVIDNTMILSICTFVGGGNLVLYEQNLLFDIPICFCIGVIALVPSLITKKFHRWQGIAMLAIYVAYIVILGIGVQAIGLSPAN